MNVNNTYDIIKTPKLIDLNGNLTKFECQFQATSDSPFYIAVMNQKMLDNGEIQFRPPEKQSGGTVKYDRDEHLAHYIALKSDTNCKVNVQIKTSPLESPIKLQDYAEVPPPQMTQVPQVTALEVPQYPQYPPPQPQYPQYPQQQYEEPQPRVEPPKTTKSNLKFFIIVGVIALIFGAVVFMKRKGKKSAVSSQTAQLPQTQAQVPQPTFQLPQLPIPHTSSLLDKIKSFPIS